MKLYNLISILFLIQFYLLYLNASQSFDEVNKNSDSLVLSGDTDSLSSVIIAGTDSIPVEIDTASNYFLTAKKKCEGCTQYPPHYKSTPTAENIMCDSPYCHSIGNVCEKQSKFDPATCSFVSQLENGASIRANLIKDIVSIDNFKNIPITITAIYKQTDGPTLTKAIFGVGPNCPNCPPSPLYSILSTLKKPYIFGISLDRNYFGGISLGLIDPLLYTKTINYTNMLKNDGLYAMTPILKSVWNNATWNSDRIQVPKVVLKSTSTLSYLPTDAFQSFKTFLKLNCGAKEMCAKMENLFTSCIPATSTEIEKFPNFQMEFEEGFTLQIKPSNYFYSLSRDGHIYQCIGIQETKRTYAVFGLNLMRELYIVFDNENNKLGFGSK